MTGPRPLEERDELLSAVRSLTEELQGLTAKLALYAPRDEVRTESRKRAWRFLAFAVAVILVAQGLTMMTISYCFLDVNAGPKLFCRAMPGYAQAVQQGSERLDRFEILLDGIERTSDNVQSNNDRLKSIEERLAKLEEESK